MPNRRTLIATTGAVALTILAGGAAIAANLGILDSTKAGPVGRLSPVADLTTTPHTGAHAAKPAVETVYLDEYVKDPAPGARVNRSSAGEGGEGSSTEPTPTTASAPSVAPPVASEPTLDAAPEPSEPSDTSDDVTSSTTQPDTEIPGAADDD